MRSGIGWFCAGLVIGMSSSVSIDLMSSSGYCTPTKYWLLADRVDPEVLLVELDARVERGDDVLHDVLLGQPQVGRLGPVDVDDVLGVVEPLDDPGVDHAVDPRRPWRWIASAIARAFSWFLPVTRMLIGVDLPSFIADADHAAGVEGELQVAEPRVARRTPVRSRWTYSWADRLRCSA